MIPQAVHETGLPDGLVAIPIRTRLVGPGDDVGALVAHAVGGIARADDIIVIAETAVAIAQRRFVAAEFVRPTRLAYALARRAGALATVNQPESLQLVIAAIDGYTGTLPPYERAIVFGPADPDRVCAELQAKLGYGFAIVDANDLRRAKALGVSPGLVRENVERALLANPHGNGDEQTPLVILTWRGGGANPLRTPA